MDSINVSAQYHPTAWSTSTLSLSNIESLQQLTFLSAPNFSIPHSFFEVNLRLLSTRWKITPHYVVLSSSFRIARICSLLFVSQCRPPDRLSFQKNHRIRSTLKARTSLDQSGEWSREANFKLEAPAAGAASESVRKRIKPVTTCCHSAEALFSKEELSFLFRGKLFACGKRCECR